MEKLIIRNAREYASQQLKNIVSVNRQSINNIKPLLQADFEKGNNCTPTSITTILHWMTGQNRSNLYGTVVGSMSPKWMYSVKKYGTLPVFIDRIANQALQALGLTSKCKSRYIKNCKFDWKTVKAYIDYGLPFILSLYNSNHGYYKWHSVVVVGYVEYMDQNDKSIKLLKIYDNWTLEDRYIDYDTLSWLSMVSRIK